MKTPVLRTLSILLLMLYSFPLLAAESDALEVETQSNGVIDGLLETLEQRQEKLIELKEQANRMSGEADPYQVSGEISADELTELIDGLSNEIAEIESQVHAVATGVNEEDYQVDDVPVDLKAEIEQLFKPMVAMLKSATEDSRQIEGLRNDLSEINRQQEMATAALDSIKKIPAGQANEALVSQLGEYQSRWQERLDVANDRAKATEQQLQTKLDSRETPGLAAGKSFGRFVKERFISLLLGVGMFLLVYGVFKGLGYLTNKILTTVRKNKPVTVPMRAGSMVYKFVSVFAALVAMLAVFNIRTDWLLLGIGAMLLLGVIWTLVKMLPEMTEQVSLLLNLGAVQEHERVMFMGVPWEVSKLSFYTVLENPLLRGGDLALPVRELIGLYSRPIANEEAWFPTKEGDWVLMDDKIAQVMLQTPETVQLKKLGGAIITIPAPSFVEEPPVNLSHGFRVELEFGLDYQHQGESTTSILNAMRQTLELELPKMLPENSMQNLEVEFFAANESSLTYEIEVDLDGSAASEYEEVQRIISRILVDAANANGWKIPFQQMVIHQPEAA